MKVIMLLSASEPSQLIIDIFLLQTQISNLHVQQTKCGLIVWSQLFEINIVKRFIEILYPFKFIYYKMIIWKAQGVPQ